MLHSKNFRRSHVLPADSIVDTGEDAFGNAVRADAPSFAEAFAGRSQEVFTEARSQVSAPVQQLLAVVQLVVAQFPSSLPEPQALADTAALLQAAEQLHAAVLGRVADVDVRKLHTLDGAPSTGAWIAQQQTSLDGARWRWPAGSAASRRSSRRCGTAGCRSRSPSGSARPWPSSAGTSTARTG